MYYILFMFMLCIRHQIGASHCLQAHGAPTGKRFPINADAVIYTYIYVCMPAYIQYVCK